MRSALVRHPRFGETAVSGAGGQSPVWLSLVGAGHLVKGAADAEVQLLPRIHRAPRCGSGSPRRGHGSADVRVRDGAEAGPEHRLLAAVGLLHDGQHRVQLGAPGSDMGARRGPPIHFRRPATACPPRPWCLRASGHHSFPAPLTPLFLQRLPPSTRRRYHQAQAIPAAKPTFSRRAWGGGSIWESLKQREEI